MHIQLPDHISLKDALGLLAAVGAWLSPSPVTRLLKGKTKMQIIKSVFAFIALLLPFVGFAVSVVEIELSDKAGAEKKAAVIARVKDKLPGLLTQAGVALPQALMDYLMADDTLGWVIDAVVALGNVVGHLMHKDAPQG